MFIHRQYYWCKVVPTRCGNQKILQIFIFLALYKGHEGIVKRKNLCDMLRTVPCLNPVVLSDL
jgi:hypothetical protein